MFSPLALRFPRLVRAATSLRRPFPLRPAGVLALLAAGALLRWSPGAHDVLLTPAGVVILGLVVVCVLIVTAAGFRLRQATREMLAHAPGRLETGTAAGTGFLCPTLRGFLIVDVGISWLGPVPVTVALEPTPGGLAEVVTASGRGRINSLTRLFTVSDVFGLCAVSYQQSWSTGVAVIPSLAKASPELAARRAQGDVLADPVGRPEGDLVEMRQYAPGDPVRHILWKTYARARRLVVRMPERSISPGPVGVAFMVAGDNDEASASAARLFVEAGLLGPDFVFAADGCDAPARTKESALEHIVTSAGHRHEGALHLADVAGKIEPARLASCFVFAPPVDGAWRGRLVDTVKRLGTKATVVIGVDRAGERQTPPLERWLFDEREGAASTDVTALKASLEAEGMAVHVLHKATGQLL
jgi:hypothetical protein